MYVQYQEVLEYFSIIGGCMNNFVFLLVYWDLWVVYFVEDFIEGKRKAIGQEGKYNFIILSEKIQDER